MKSRFSIGLVLVMNLSNRQVEINIEQLLNLMEQAVRDGNWFKVKEANKKIHLLLSFSRTKPWFDSVEPQRKLMKKRYENIINLIANQQSDIKMKMQNHQNNEEGIKAYMEVFERGSL